MSQRAPAAVLFDLDGTLVSTKDLYLESYRRALVPYLGRDLTDDEILALRPLSERRFLEAQLADPRQFDACFDAFCAAYTALHATHFGGVYPGVTELLAALRARGTTLGLVSGKSRRSWEVTAAVAALGEFDVVVLDDDVGAPKPDPHGLRLALERLGAEPGDALYVGDTLSDARAARAAGVTPGAALWSRPAERRAELERRVLELGGVAFHEPAAVLSYRR